MNLAHGGHLTHGMALNFSGRLTRSTRYGVREDDERIDYDALERQAREVRPKLIVGGASAYPRIIDFERMAEIAHGGRARCCSWTWPTSRGSWRRASTRARSRTPISSRRPPTRPSAAPRGGMIFSRARAARRRVDPADFPMVKAHRSRQTIDRSVFPGVQGGPLMHVIAGKAVGFKLAAEPRSSATTSAARVANARRAGRDARGGRAPGSSPAARTTTSCWST